MAGLYIGLVTAFYRSTFIALTYPFPIYMYMVFFYVPLALINT